MVGVNDTSIYEAAVFGDLARVRELIAEDPTCVNAAAEFGFRPLHGVAGEDQMEMAEFLIRHGADVNACNDNGTAPLHLAAYPEFVGLLVRHGADVNAPDRDGGTPLHVQVTEPDTEDVLAALLVAGADPDMRDRWGKTARDYATDRQEFEKVTLLGGG